MKQKFIRAVRYQEVESHPFPGVTIIDYLPPGHARPLQQGDLYQLTPDCGTGDEVFEVIGVTAASALVRHAAAERRQYVGKVKKTRTVNGQQFKVDTGETRVVEFTVPQRPFQVSRFSSVVLVEQREEQEA